MDEKKDFECCPIFDPKPWDRKVIEWDNKMFVKEKVFTIFYMPINFGSVMKRVMNNMDKAGAGCPDWLALSDHTSMFNMDVYCATDKGLPDSENVKMSGKFLCRVYEGPYSDTKKWMEDFNRYAEDEEKRIKKYYMWYTTCPKCAKKYGKNYVVTFGKFE
jgi:hypothetical protein